jgi:ribosomal protein S6--L-glutamate ligase
MILSFHPCYIADCNRICAGRLPEKADLLAIQASKAVILPQGSSQALYDMARHNCRHVFPSLDAKFEYPGKSGQIRLFRKFKISHPKTLLFDSTADFKQTIKNNNLRVPFPLVLKFNWGGEGEGVFFIHSDPKMQQVLKKVAAFEASGQKGFLIQEFIPCANRSLRVVVINERLISYWRVQKKENTFFSHISKGARLDHNGDLALQKIGQRAVIDLCQKTGINLAGFDILFPENKKTPLFLEINYFFGRSGLGGSEKYYELLLEQIRKWIEQRVMKGK